MSTWETIIGLEIHAELNTRSKLFSKAPNRFGDEPNTNISVVCTGMPGALPVLNREAVKKAVQFGCAINGTINHYSKFDRKSYFYPDSPRNFQITQFDEPIITGGEIIAEIEGEEHSFAVDRVHLEDDAGMLKHFNQFAGIDYNRAGVPLIEIVSKPCIHSPEQAAAYAMAVRAILQYLDVSDCNMEEGSLRFDANISIRKFGEKALRNKTEIKNMNSFTNLQLALKDEIARQTAFYEKNPEGIIPQSTYRFDPETKTVVQMRVKERADDYRYFPEPDLPPIVLTQNYIDAIKQALPELPLQRERRYIQELSLSPDAAFILTADKLLADYFEEALKFCTDAKSLCNWLIVEFPGRFKETGTSIANSTIPPKHVGSLISLIEKGTITGRIAKSIADEMVKTPLRPPEEIVASNPDYQPLSDHSQIETIVDEVLKNHPQSVEDFKNGKTKALSFLIGQVMQQTRGKASPDIVNTIISKKIL